MPNQTGDTYGVRQGSDITVHTFPVAFNTTGIASGVFTGTIIKASADKPVQIEVSAQVVTAFNAASTNVLTAGTSTTANEWLDSTNITEGTPGYYPASNAVKKFRLTAGTGIYVKYTQTGDVAATGTLTSNNTNVSDADTVTIGSKVYTFKTALTPTEGEVLIGGSADASLLNLIRAINHTGTYGTDYYVSVANAQVSAASSVTSHTFAVTALSTGTAGNSIATTETAATLSWGAATLASGVDAATTGAAVIIVREFQENTKAIV